MSSFVKTKSFNRLLSFVFSSLRAASLIFSNNSFLSEFNNDPEFLQTLFIEKMKDYFKSVGYLCTYTVQKNTAVPNDEDEFIS